MMLALGVPALVLGSYTPRSSACRSVPAAPKFLFPAMGGVLCADGADAGGALLGPVTGLPGNAGKGLSGRGGYLQPIHTSNIKQVC